MGCSVGCRARRGLGFRDPGGFSGFGGLRVWGLGFGVRV